MNLAKFAFAFFVSFAVGGCVAANNEPQRTNEPPRAILPKKLPVSYALPGTTTAVVGIAINKEGVPQETVREIVLLPGQKVLFAGPDRFQIVFKDKKSPNSLIRQDSKDGVITVNIPKDILDRGQYVEEFKKNNYIKFNYSIIVNGKELDPPLIIKRDY